MALIVEVLHPRSREVRARVRVGALPFTIGRALDNDCVLDDPHVDAHHARLVAGAEGGAPALEDLGSLNGLRTGGRRVPRVEARDGAEVVVGRTRIRLRDDQAPVPAAVALDEDLSGPVGLLERPLVRPAVVLGTFVLAGVDGWLETDSSAGADSALSLTIGLFGLASIWAGVWAAVGRVVTHHARFVAHLAIASLALLALQVGGTLEEWIRFLFPAAGSWAWLSGVAGLGLVAVTVIAHLRQATHLSRAGRRRAALTTTVVLLAIAGAFRLVEDDAFTAVPEFAAQVKPAPLAIVPTTGVDALPEVLAGLKDEVDRLATEAPQ